MKHVHNTKLQAELKIANVVASGISSLAVVNSKFKGCDLFCMINSGIETEGKTYVSTSLPGDQGSYGHRVKSPRRRNGSRPK